jgi:L-asparaginase
MRASGCRKNMRGKRRVYVINTGGTIGMKQVEGLYAPAPGYLSRQMVKIPALDAPEMPEVEIMECSPLMDSAYMTPDDWTRIAREIAENHEAYDGIVVVHGTDTMAYTASALPFMLDGLAKPVILTGSQVPLCEVRNDAYENLVTSLLIAANYPIPEVCIFFAGKLLRGCRSVKVDAHGFEAFDSPNFAPLGRAGVDIHIDWDRVLPGPPEGSKIRVRGVGEPMVGTLRLFPGITAGAVRNILRPPLRGLILEAYGVGNGPSNDGAFLDAIREAVDRGVVIMATSQCIRGGVGMDNYEASNALVSSGVLSGGDMTTEAALTKLYCLLSTQRTSEQVCEAMGQNMRGELTV